MKTIELDPYPGRVAVDDVGVAEVFPLSEVGVEQGGPESDCALGGVESDPFCGGERPLGVGPARRPSQGQPSDSGLVGQVAGYRAVPRLGINPVLLIRTMGAKGEMYHLQTSLGEQV